MRGDSVKGVRRGAPCELPASDSNGRTARVGPKHLRARAACAHAGVQSTRHGAAGAVPRAARRERRPARRVRGQRRGADSAGAGSKKALRPRRARWGEVADVSAPRRPQPRARVCACHPPCGAARFLPAKPTRGPHATGPRCGRRTDGWPVARAQQCPGVRPADRRPSHRQAGSCAHVLSPAHIPYRRRT